MKQISYITNKIQRRLHINLSNKTIHIFVSQFVLYSSFGGFILTPKMFKMFPHILGLEISIFLKDDSEILK